MADSEALRKNAKRAYKAGELQAAVELYARLAEDPQGDDQSRSADLFGYASALIAVNRLNEAATQIERAAALQPDDPKISVKLAEVLSRVGRHEEAADQFRNLIRLEPGSADNHWRLALELRALGRDAEAREELRRCLAINPDHTEAQIFQLEQMMLGGAERDGQSYEAEEPDNANQPASGDIPPATPLRRPTASAPVARRQATWRSRPWGVAAEALVLVAVALWLKGLIS
jgi:tetratricopeptide (TPR) repeat protein